MTDHFILSWEAEVANEAAVFDLRWRDGPAGEEVISEGFTRRTLVITMFAAEDSTAMLCHVSYRNGVLSGQVAVELDPISEAGCPAQVALDRLQLANHQRYRFVDYVDNAQVFH